MALLGLMPELASFDRRDCVVCPDNVVPSCPPSCPTGYLCSVGIQTCSSCAFSRCDPDPNYRAPVSATTNSGPNAGAIAGGVIGGVVAIALLVYLVWRFCVKNKRQQYEPQDWVEFQDGQTEAEKEFARRRDARTSTHTVASIASTVLTRASNIIQIAYIPGVTNRSAPSTPGHLVPPVPPIPIALAGTPEPADEDEHFFMPGDLRGSTYSGMTDRTSYAPRSSVASTIYGKNAVVSPVPAQTVIRGKAAVVSVKSNGGHSPGDVTPPVPFVDYEKYKEGRSSPAFSVGSTFLNSNASQARPSMIRNSDIQDAKDFHDSVDGTASPSALGRESAAITFIDDTPLVDDSPFGDPPPRAAGHTKNASLSAVIEEATKRAHGDVRAGLGLKREGSKTPFGDEHTTDKE